MRFLVLLTLLLVPLAGAAEGPDDVAAYPWVIDNEDPEGDHGGPTPHAAVPVPNDANPESDILRVQVTDDADTLIAKVTMATCTFGVPSGFAYVIIEMGALEMSAQYSDGCADVEPAEVDSALAPVPVVGGDADEQIAGLRVAAVPDENAIYFFSDYSENGLQPGDALSFTRIHTGRQFTDPGRYTFGLDEADTFDFTIGSGAALLSPPAPAQQAFQIDMFDLLAFSNATSDTYLVNTTAPFRLDFDVEAGAVNVTFQETTTRVAESGSLDIAGDGSVLNLTFDGFVGTLTTSVAEAPAETPEDGNETVPDTPETDATGNGTDDEALDGGVDDKESPGLPGAFLAAAMLVGVALRRRR